MFVIKRFLNRKECKGNKPGHHNHVGTPWPPPINYNTEEKKKIQR